MPRPQFRLRSLFILTAIVAVGCLVGPPIVREVRDWLASWQEIGEPGTIKPYVNNTNWFVASDEDADLETDEEMAPAPVQASPPTE
jgi:hypothetical protein